MVVLLQLPQSISLTCARALLGGTGQLGLPILQAAKAPSLVGSAIGASRMPGATGVCVTLAKQIQERTIGVHLVKGCAQQRLGMCLLRNIPQRPCVLYHSRPSSCFFRCPHDKKCIVCDTWSCAACKIVRGDGDVVAGLAATMAPNVTIFLDFDRTIASTKCGADPLIGSHSIDASLLCVMNAHRYLLWFFNFQASARNIVMHAQGPCAYINP